jgi:hypothetical protein
METIYQKSRHAGRITTDGESYTTMNPQLQDHLARTKAISQKN